jgi:signal transduction histidine kinase
MPSPPAPVPAAAERLAKLVDRTARLHRLTAHLSTALRIDDVAQIVVDEGTSALEAYSGALWRLDEATNELVLLRSSNYSAEALASVARLPLDPAVPIADAAVRGQPVWLSSRKDYEERYPASAARTRALQTSGYSVAALPIVLDGASVAVMALTFLNERGFNEDERGYLGFLVLHCAQGFQRARLYAAQTDARREAEIAKERAQFLLKASALLGSSLDYEETLRNVAAIAVPNIGDWCGVELVDEDGTTKQVAVAHIDPAKVELAHEVRRRYPPNPNAPTGVPHILRTGASELYREISDELLVAGAVDADHLRILRDLGLRSAMAVPIKDREAVVGVISFISAKPERLYSSDDLLMAEQLGERAGAAITNAKLYTAAREAIRARDEFMLVAGHELRTPLAALSLHHEALINTREGTTLDKVRERGGKLKAQSERLIRLVEDLLDVSRLSAGRLSLELDDVDLGALAREVTERLHDDLERAHSPITVDLAEVHGRWDKARLDQVITNLVTNAVKYGKGSPIEVRVSREGPLAKLTVTDHGIGIAAHDQQRIFKRFERAVSSRKFGGLGLGLWITSQLVHAHGGTITVDSQLGAGATFTVLLPLASPVTS